MHIDIREASGILSLVWPDWKITETIGSGAFATVFRAERLEKIPGERDSAIKLIRIPQDDGEWDRMLSEGKTEEQTRRFYQDIVEDSLKEIRTMEELSGHTNIVNIYDYKRYHDPEKNVWYILIRMELLQKVDAGALTEKDVIRLGKDVCTALKLCRSKNIVHRDVSLDNIFIHDGHYKLGDFGVAKVLEGTLSGLKSLAGKPLYMAPEIYNATLTETDLDSAGRVDIYSLGILMYRLCHRMNYPFEDADKESVSASERGAAFKRRVIDGENLPPPQYASPGLAQVILKACMANPNKRYAGADEMYEALEALEKPQDAPKKPISKRKLLIAAAVAAAVALLCGGLWCYLGMRGHRGEQAKDTYHILLTAPDDMNVKNFSTTLKGLQERLDLFTGGRGNYGWSVQEDRIDLELPREPFAGEYIDQILAVYLIRPTELYMYSSAGKAAGTIRIDRENIESVTLKEGVPEGLEGFSGDWYVEMVLSEDFVAEYADIIASWDDAVFAQDCVKVYDGSWISFKTQSAGDGRTWYFSVYREDLAALFCHNMTHDPLPDALNFEIDLDDLTVWQRQEETALWGKNQCDAKELSGELVTFLLAANEMTEGEKLDTEMTLKARLDSIGTPYALGVSDTCPLQGMKNYTLFYSVKISSERMNENLVYILLSKYEIVLQGGLIQAEMSMSKSTLRKDENGYGFYLTPGDWINTDEMIRLAAEKAKEGSGYMVLRFDAYSSGMKPLFAISAEALQEDGSYLVRDLCTVQEGRFVPQPMGEEDGWLYEFFKSLIDNSNFPELLWLRAYQISQDGVISQAEQEDVLGLEVIESAARKIWPAAVVEGGNGYSTDIARIYLSFEDEKALIETGPDIVRQIYESLDFENRYADWLHFALQDADGKDRANLYFVKKYSTTDPEKGGYIFVRGTFAKAMTDEEQQALMDTINAMDFYRELTYEESTWGQLTY